MVETGCLRLVCPRGADEDLRFGEALAALLQEERVPLGPLDQEPPERGQAGIASEERMQECLGVGIGQGLQRKLRVVGLPPPPVLVVRAIADEEEHAHPRQSIDQAVQHTLGLRVGPVEVFEDDYQRPHLALPEQQARDRLPRPILALGRVQRQERMVGGQRLEEVEQGEYCLLGHRGTPG